MSSQFISQDIVDIEYHSTESAIMKIVCDALLAADCGEITLLGLLDLSVAFDMVDRDILIERLHTSFGGSGSALAWINSSAIERKWVFLMGSSRLIRHWNAVFLKEVCLDRYFSFSIQLTSLQSSSVIDWVRIPMQMTFKDMQI